MVDSSVLKKAELVPLIVRASVDRVRRLGERTRSANGKGTILIYETGELRMLYRTPLAEILTAPSNFGVDIWYSDKKMFSAIWNSTTLLDFEVICFKRGPWIPLLLQKSSETSGG